MRSRTSRARLKRLRDVSLYVLVGLAVVAAALLYAPYHRPGNDGIIDKWVGLTFNTLVLFGYTIRRSRSLWRIPSFWICLTALFAVHLLGFIWILLHVDTWRLIWFIGMYPLETPLINLAILWTTEKYPGSRLPRHNGRDDRGIRHREHLL